jgi:hypothetical protein
MDVLELERRAVDEIQPQLSCLMDALNRLPDTPKDFEPNRVLLCWLGKDMTDSIVISFVAIFL